MDGWKYHHITGQHLDMLNPCNPGKLDILFDLMDLTEGARVLDMGSGKGEALLRLAKRSRIAGIGVDFSPFFTQEAMQRATLLGEAGSGLRFLAVDGRHYIDSEPFDAALCLGASWIFGGVRKTAEAMAAFLGDTGYVIIGEPHFVRPPSCEYLNALEELGSDPEAELSLVENVSAAESAGLVALHCLVSTQEEYDAYEWQRVRAAEQYAMKHPDDPDVRELLRRSRTHRDLYLRYARDTVGWALYLFAKHPATGP